MRHYKKILLVTAAVLVPVVIAVIAAVRFLPETDLIRNSLRDKLSELTGHNVRLGALKVTMSFPSVLNLTLEGVSVSSREGKSLLQAGTVAFSPSLASMFSRQILIESVVIRRLKVVVRRAQDGTVENPFVPALPSRSVEVTRDGEQRETPSNAATDKALPPKPTPTRDLDQRLKWSIDKLQVVDASVQLIDREIVPGEPARTSLDNINCTLHRQKPGNSFSLNLDAEFIGGNRAKSPIHADGTLIPAEDFTRLQSANIIVSLKSLDLKGLQDYVPPWARLVEKFDVASSRAEIDWKNDEDTRVAFKIDVSGKSKEAPQLKFQGTAVVTRDFSTLRRIQGTGESDRLPLRLFSRYVPKEFPLDSRAGTLKASVEGHWESKDAWKLQGNVGLEEGLPKGRFRKIAGKVRIWSQLRLTPELLNLESLEVSSSTTLAALAGTIANPLASNSEYDLEGRVNLDPAWLGAFGVRLPKDLTLRGTIPVQGRGRGGRDRLWVDLTGDLTSTKIGWAPYVEKKPGNKGTVSIKGNFLLSPGQGRRRRIPATEVRVGLSGATVRVKPDGPRLPNCAIDFASKILLNSGGADLKDAVLALRRGSGARNVIIAGADLVDVGSKSARVNGKVTLNLNRTTLALTGVDIPRGVELVGSTQLRADFKGSVRALAWSLDVPLTHLDVQVDKAFRKPGGVKAHFAASGKWALEELTMTEGKLSLPGLVITGNGSLTDKHGKFRGLTLSSRNAELKQLAKMLPALSDKGLSGPIDFTVRLRPSSKGPVADGKVRLLKVDFRPQGAAWKIENIRGTLESDGNFLESSGLTGEIKGPVEGPLTVKGKLSRIQSPDTMNGKVSLQMGKGRIQAGRLQDSLGKARLLLDALFRPGQSGTVGDRRDFDSAKGSITISSGTAKTEDIQMKGRDLALGAMGKCRLKTSNLDLLLGIKTYTIAPSFIGKIPAVKKLMKQHEGLLKALGVDKELKRLGLGEPDKDSEKNNRNEIKRTPVTVILKLTGQASSPDVVPVLESALSKDAAARIKALLN